MTAPTGIDWVSARWKVLLELGAWIATLVGGFMMLPPYLDPGTAAALTKFGQFLAASLAGLLLLPLTIWAGARYLRWWWGLGVLILFASLAVFFNYNAILARDTVPYDGSRIIAGSATEYTKAAKQHLASLQEAGLPTTREQMVMDFVGDTPEIWPEATLRENEERLIGTYFLALALFSTFIVVLAHVVATSLSGERPKEHEPV